MRSSKPAFSKNASNLSVGIGQTRTDSMNRGKHGSSNQNIDSVAVSRHHIPKVIAPRPSDPKAGTSEGELLVSPRELSLPPIALGSRQQSDHTISVVVNGSNSMVLPCRKRQSHHSHSASLDSKSYHRMKPTPSPTQRHLVGSLQGTLDPQKSGGDASLALLGADYSKEAENKDLVATKIIDLMLPHQRIINSSVESPRFIRQQGSFGRRSNVDTAAPFESVKEAVSKFGSIVDWKANKVQSMERFKLMDQELDRIHEELPEYKKQSEEVEEAKIKVLKELDSTKRLIEEIKLSLERAQTEENQAKQDSELAKLRMEEMEQGIADEASVAAKTQLEVAKARHETAVSELKSVIVDLEELGKQYDTLIIKREMAIKKAEEAVSASKEVERTVEDFTIELITIKDSLESAHMAQLDAEEKRITVAMARDQDTLQWKKDLKQGEEEFQRINQQVNFTKELKSKIDIASALLLDLKAELAAYRERTLKDTADELSNDEADTSEGRPHTDMQAAISSAKKELLEMKHNIEKAIAEVESLKETITSLKSQLGKEKSKLEEIRSEATIVQTEKMAELPKELQQAAQEAEKAKSLAQIAQQELFKSKEEAERAKTGAGSIESRLLVTRKEIEAAKVSEKLALAVIKVLQASESAHNVDSSTGVTLSAEEYYELNKREYEVEAQSNMRMAAIKYRIEIAKQSQSKSLEKLEEVNKEIPKRKDALRSAMEKAKKAREGKLRVEQELRKWRAEHEQQRMATGSNHGGITPSISLEEHKETPADPSDKTNQTVTEPAQEPKSKKKSIIPKFFMFLSRKKSKP